MIGYLCGTVKFIFEDNIILNVGGVGYRIFLDSRTLENLNAESEAEFFIHTSVREDAIQLYGFRRQMDYKLFLQLITVSGIGVKTALNVLSKISSKDLAAAIYQQNVKVLGTLPGVGKKTAQRLILELKDKIPVEFLAEEEHKTDEWAPNVEEQNSFDEAEEALLALGYTNAEIAEVFKRAENFMSTEEIIKLALKELNRF